MTKESKSQKKTDESQAATQQELEQVTPVAQDARPDMAVQKAKINPRRLSPNEVISLQRTLGNRAVSRILNRPSTTSTPIQRPRMPEEEETLQPTFQPREPTAEVTMLQRQDVQEEKEILQPMLQRQELPKEKDAVQAELQREVLLGEEGGQAQSTSQRHYDIGSINQTKRQLGGSATAVQADASRHMSHMATATQPYGAINKLRQHSPTVAASSSMIQRRKLREVGAVREGSSLRFEDGKWKGPGQAGYSQLLVGASGEMALDMTTSGSLSNLMLPPISPELGGMQRQQLEWAARAKRAEDRKPWGAPPSIGEFFDKMRAGAQNQAKVVSRARQTTLRKVHNYNAFTSKANTFIQSAARLSSMQALVGATDNQALASALVTGVNEAKKTAQDYQKAYRRPGSGVSDQLTLPAQDATVENQLGAVDNAGSQLRTSYNNFRLNLMQDFIRRLNEAGKEDRDRLDEINKNKAVIAKVGKTIDLAMPYISPSTTMFDAAITQGKGALPTPGGALNLIADLAYQREIEKINTRLGTLNNAVSAERETLDLEKYNNRRDDFVLKLRAMKTARDQLKDRMQQRRESYRNLGEQLDRFRRSSAGGNKVAQGREHFTTILTLVAQVREVLGTGSWASSGAPTEATIRAWVSDQLNYSSENYRISGLTSGEQAAIRTMLAGSRTFANAYETTRQVFGPVGAAAGTMLGGGPLRAEGTGEY